MNLSILTITFICSWRTAAVWKVEISFGLHGGIVWEVGVILAAMPDTTVDQFL